MEAILAKFLIAHAPLAALVADRIDWDQAPQGLAPPLIVMFLISAPVDYTMQRASKLVPYRVQFDCRGATAAQARDIAAALDGRLSGYRGTYDSVRIDGAFKQSQRSSSHKDGASGWFTASLDYIIWSKPA